jgi:hypothetical protein
VQKGVFMKVKTTGGAQYVQVHALVVLLNMFVGDLSVLETMRRSRQVKFKDPQGVVTRRRRRFQIGSIVEGRREGEDRSRNWSNLSAAIESTLHHLF